MLLKNKKQEARLRQESDHLMVKTYHRNTKFLYNSHRIRRTRRLIDQFRWAIILLVQRNIFRVDALCIFAIYTTRESERFSIKHSFTCVGFVVYLLILSRDRVALLCYKIVCSLACLRLWRLVNKELIV